MISSAQLNEKLMMASSTGNVSEVRRLLGAGADLRSVNRNGWTPLIFASVNGHVDVVEAMLDHCSLQDRLNSGHEHPRRPD